MRGARDDLAARNAQLMPILSRPPRTSFTPACPKGARAADADNSPIAESAFACGRVRMSRASRGRIARKGLKAKVTRGVWA